MKKFNTFFLAVITALFTFSSCDESSPEQTSADGYGYDFTEVLATYTDDVVLPTYADMKNKCWTLYDAVQAFKSSKTQTSLNAVCAAWRATRIPWEQSESFLYGPAEILDLDPSLDSWPLKKGEIDKIISDGNISISKIQDPGVHGFHTIEYLIFVDGNPRVLSSNPITDTEIQYLDIATEYLRDDCIKLWAAWNGASNIPTKDQTVLKNYSDFNPDEYNYAYKFKNAVSSGTNLTSKDDAIDNIVEGCSSIADEVGAQKIGAPRDLALGGNLETAVLEVESWYSWNSIDDYANNIVSIRNSYFGGIGKTASNKSANSLSVFVRSKNAALDAEITAAIDKAYTAINSDMQRPFRNYLTGAKVDAAINACMDLDASFKKIKNLRD